MTLFIEIVYVFITIVLILVVLLQAGKGGGLGTALGGGASQGVFGGGGGADFLAKLTQGLATGFMVCAVYLAYASAHTGSSRLAEASDESTMEVFDEDEAVDYERIGEGTPLPLPDTQAGSVVPAPQAVPEAPPEIEVEATTPDVEVVPGDAAVEMPAVEGDAAATPTTPAEPTEAEGDQPLPVEVEAEPAKPKPAKAKPAKAKPEPATESEAPTAEPTEPEPTEPEPASQGA